MAVRRLVPWVLAVTLVLACALVLLLAKRVRDLSADYRQLRLLSTLPHAGTVVPTFRTATLAGDSITVGETADSGASQILYVFNTTCPYCRAIIPIWEQIADSLKWLKRPVQVLAISLDSADTTRRYVAEHAFGIRYSHFLKPSSSGCFERERYRRQWCSIREARCSTRELGRRIQFHWIRSMRPSRVARSGSWRGAV